MSRDLEEQLKDLNQSPASEPDQAWIQSCRSKLQWMTENPIVRRVPSLARGVHRFSWLRVLKYAGVLSVGMIVFGSGLAYAAQGCTPQQILYPIKLASEDVRRVLAGNVAATTRLELEFADRRVEELKIMAKTKTLDERTAAELQARYQAHMVAALAALPRAPSPAVSVALANEIAATTQKHIDGEKAFESDFAIEPEIIRIQATQREMKARLKQMMDFAKESTQVAEIMKQNTDQASVLNVKIENDEDGKAHVRVEVKKRAQGEETAQVREFTLPQGAATTSEAIVPFFREETEEEGSASQENIDRGEENDTFDDKKLSPQVYTTTTLYFENGNVKEDEQVLPKNLRDKFKRFFNRGIELNVQTSQSIQGGAVEQYIQTNTHNETRIEWNDESERKEK